MIYFHYFFEGNKYKCVLVEIETKDFAVKSLKKQSRQLSDCLPTLFFFYLHMYCPRIVTK